MNKDESTNFAEIEKGLDRIEFWLRILKWVAVVNIALFLISALVGK